MRRARDSISEGGAPWRTGAGAALVGCAGGIADGPLLKERRVTLNAAAAEEAGPG